MPERLNVKALRQKLGLSQEELASRIGVTGRTIARWESGVGGPRGLQVSRLTRLREEDRRRSPRSRFRVGVCCEFVDTTLPVLCNTPTNSAAYHDLDAPEFVPVPWDDRCLSALRNGLLDVVTYNEHCAMKFQMATAAGFVYGRESSTSGRFYIAIRFPSQEAKENHLAATGRRGAKRAEMQHLLDRIWDAETVNIVPHADMRVSTRLLYHACKGEFPSPEVEEDWLSLQPGQGLATFLHPQLLLSHRIVTFTGGQDQLSAIEGTKDYESSIFVIHAQDIEEAIGLTFPPELSRNILVAGNSFQPNQQLDKLEAAIADARMQMARVSETVRDQTASPEDKRLFDQGVLELARWHHLHNSRFLNGRSEDLLGVFQTLRPELSETIQRSFEASRWLPGLLQRI